MALRPKPPVRALGGGVYQLELADDAREVLGNLIGQLRELLLADDPVLRRLNPTAYVDNPEHEAEYRSMMAGDLLESRFAMLDTVEETLGRSTLDEDELTRWMLALNSLRLVIGTRLDVQEDQHAMDLDPEDPDVGLFHIYEFLGYLLDAIVTALAGNR